MGPSVIKHVAHGSSTNAAVGTPTAGDQNEALLDSKPLMKHLDMLHTKSRFIHSVASLLDRVMLCLGEIAGFKWRVTTLKSASKHADRTLVEHFRKRIVEFSNEANELVLEITELLRAGIGGATFEDLPVEIARLKVDTAELDKQVAQLELALVELETAA